MRHYFPTVLISFSIRVLFQIPVYFPTVSFHLALRVLFQILFIRVNLRLISPRVQTLRDYQETIFTKH